MTQSSQLEIPKTLAIDYGLARVGLAISYGSLAEPLSTTTYSNVNDLILSIKKVVHHQRVEQILVGVSGGRMAQRTTEFINQLMAEVQLPVITADENYSTESARSKLRSVNSRPRVVDHYAAAEFLQDWLDEN